jgi:hypothetical protein
MSKELERTTLQVFKTTQRRLKKLGQRNEDYDSIINRAIDGDFCNLSQSQKKRRDTK